MATTLPTGYPMYQVSIVYSYTWMVDTLVSCILEHTHKYMFIDQCVYAVYQENFVIKYISYGPMFYEISNIVLLYSYMLFFLLIEISHVTLVTKFSRSTIYDVLPHQNILKIYMTYKIAVNLYKSTSFCDFCK